jgi:hypothetical protein
MQGKEGRDQIRFFRFREQIQQFLGREVSYHTCGRPKMLPTEPRPEAAQIGPDLHKNGPLVIPQPADPAQLDLFDPDDPILV